MPTLIITADPDCCRCRSKIQKVLCCIQERREFEIEKIVFDKDKVLVSGPFDADKLSCKLCSKAGRCIKKIEVEKPKPKPESVKEFIPFPYPCLPCSCPPPYCQCPPPPPPKLPKPEPCKGTPYPYPCPYPQPAWGYGACPPPYCQSPPPEPKPAPPASQCPTGPSCHHCCGGSYLPSPMPCSPMVICQDSPPYGICAIM